ncbi:MAG: hypothetical protein M3066_16120 [Actinomycetota bacterium]|nr:hypothetical protein [Actinomycetota bacterium]
MPIGVSRVFYAALDRRDLFDGLGGLPGRLDIDPAPTPEDAVPFLLRAVFTDQRRIEGVAKLLRIAGVRCEALSRGNRLRLWIEGDIFVGSWDQSSAVPLIYTAGKEVGSATSEVWELIGGGRAAIDVLAPRLLDGLTWSSVQGIVDDLYGFAAKLVLASIVRPAPC